MARQRKSVRARRAANRQRVEARRRGQIGLEQLEQRLLLSVGYVDQLEDFRLDQDRDGSLGVSAGDIVSWRPDAASGWTTGLEFGADAFDAIQSAIAVANPGGVINVAAGTYAENVDIDKSLNLYGPQAGVDPVAGGRAGGEALVRGSNEYPFVIRANDVTVDGMAIGGDYRYGLQIRCVENPTGADTVDNVSVSYTYLESAASWSAILFGEDYDGDPKRAGDGLVSNLELSNNLIVHGAGNPESSSRAISPASGFTGFMTYDGITITDNEFVGPGPLDATSHTMMFCGVNPASFLMNDLVFDRNTVEGFRTGMNVMNIRGASIQDNSFDDIRYGLYINVRGTDTEPALIKDNVFEGLLTGAAVNLAGPAWGAPLGDEYVDIADNTFNYNQVVYTPLYPALWLDPGVDAATVRISGNSILDGGANATPAAAVQNDSGTGTVDATLNWWGTADEAEIAAMLVGPVDYIPFLVLGSDHVVVDNDWSGHATGTEVQVGNGVYSVGTNAFATLSDAYSAVEDGGTITVLPGSYIGGLVVDKGITLDGSGGGVTITGGSPALTVNTGDVIVQNGVTLSTNTADPTVLVLGGSLQMRDSSVLESSTSDESAIEIQGGVVDLGTGADAGANVINIRGAGQLINVTSRRWAK